MNFTFSKAKCVGNLLQSLHVNELYTGFFSLYAQRYVSLLFLAQNNSLLFIYNVLILLRA